jgi:hypothetical protein
MTKEVCINPNLYGFKKISGMIYTAFSRVNSLKNLYLSYPINLSVISADPRVIEFYKRLIN